MSRSRCSGRRLHHGPCDPACTPQRLDFVKYDLMRAAVRHRGACRLRSRATRYGQSGRRCDRRRRIRPERRDGEPLGRAQVLFQPLMAGISPVVIESDERGAFLFYDLKPGTYSVQVTRDGYLPVSHGMRGSVRRPPYLTFEEGSRTRDLLFRLKRWSVIAGKVKFDTGEPGIGLVVQVLRQSFIRNRRGFVLVTTARTNDLGEYRIAALARGGYL